MTSPLDVLDYCSQGCQPEVGAVAVWDGETCTCCGGEWGGASEGVCRRRHITGWEQALDEEHGNTGPVAKGSSQVSAPASTPSPEDRA